MEISLNQLLKGCKTEKVRECLSKLTWKGETLQRSLFTKMNKDTLCDTLIFIAETLLEAGSKEEENDDNSNQSFSTPKNTSSTQEESGEETEEKDNNSQKVPDTRPICQLFLDNRCPSGIKGRNCSQQHPKQCRKFLQGGRSKEGCQDWNCQFLHPKICPNSYLFGSCQKSGCKRRHIKTKKILAEEPEDRSFLWQKQFQSQIDKLTEMNLSILQALTQSHPRPIPVWNQAPQDQTRPPQPRWATNIGL